MLIFRKKKDSGRPADALRLRVINPGAGSGVAAGAEFALECGDSLIGRDAACEIVFKSPTVSRRHAKIHVRYDRRRVTISDLGSANGTLVRPATRLRNETCALESGAEFQVGDVLLQLLTDADEGEGFTMIAVPSPLFEAAAPTAQATASGDAAADRCSPDTPDTPMHPDTPAPHLSSESFPSRRTTKEEKQA